MHPLQLLLLTSVPEHNNVLTVSCDYITRPPNICIICKPVLRKRTSKIYTDTLDSLVPIGVSNPRKHVIFADSPLDHYAFGNNSQVSKFLRTYTLIALVGIKDKLHSNNMYFTTVLLVIFTLCYVNSMEEGDPCILTSNSQRGECKSILNCPAALEDIKHQKFPQTCGFAGSVPRVCCVDGPPPTPKPTTTTTQRTTTKTTPPTRVTPKVPSNASYVNPYQPNTPGYKSFEKCLQYSKLVFSYEKPPILIIDKKAKLENTCGFRVIPLVVGGELTSRREFPHMALVGYESSDGIQWLCGGSLISENFVLTAAHCLISREFGNASHVRLGVTEINDPGNRQDRKVMELFYYPTYALPSHYDDIGLLKLEKNVNFDIYVRPACLHNFRNPLGQRAVATGWGKTDFAGYPSDKLLKVILSLSDPVTCYDSFSRVSQQRLERGIDDKIMVCAGSQGKDTCQGDSGGPLQIYSPIDCMYEIIGVTSFGKACGIGKSPGVYTRVSHYIEWVENHVFT